MALRDKPKSKRRRKIILLSVLGCSPVLVFASVELTSTPGFCSSCHEMEPAYRSWQSSDHGPVDGSARAECRDCHLPGWDDPVDLIATKVSHGVGDLYAHFSVDDRLDEPDFYFSLKHRAKGDVTDAVCLDCHGDVRDPEKDVIESEEGEVRGLHSSEEARRAGCLMCHKHTSHTWYE